MDTAGLTFGHGVVVGVGVVALALVALFILRPWRRAFFSGAPVPLATIIGMRLRGNPPDFLIDAYLELAKGGIRMPMDHVECVFIKSRSAIRTPHDLAELARKVHEDTQKDDAREQGVIP